MAAHGGSDLPQPDLSQAGEGDTAADTAFVAHSGKDVEGSAKQTEEIDQATGHVACEIQKNKKDEQRIPALGWSGCQGPAWHREIWIGQLSHILQEAAQHQSDRQGTEEIPETKEESRMTKFVSIIGNGESRLGFDLIPLKKIGEVIGCNAQFRDYNFDYFVCADRHMCQEAANTVGKNTIIYTRQKWHKEFAMWSNVRSLPDLPYQGTERADEPFHWGTGPYAGVVALNFKPKVIFMIGFDLHAAEKDKVNNIYKNSKGYEYIKRPVDPSYWIHQFEKLMALDTCRWIVVNREGWQMPAEWAKHKNVFQESYEGMAQFINKELTKSK